MNWKQLKPKIEKLILQGKTPEEIALQLHVDTFNLKQFIHRERIVSPQNAKKILAFELVKLYTRGHPEYFKPQRDFFKTTRIKQKRWWALYRGEKSMTQEEYLRVTEHLSISLQEAFDARQLSFIPELEENRNDVH